MLVLWAAAAFMFGAADQYLGSFSAHPLWGDVSGLSAPWLALPFIVGAFQRSGRRAVVVGIACTFLALCGYMLMTFSPMENAHLTGRGLAEFLRGGNFQWFVAGTLTGPIFAWLGYKWRLQRALVAGLVIASMICLEPVVRHLYGNAIRHALVAETESAMGIAVAAVMLWLQLASKRRRGTAT